jgi:hypothetical protein
MRRLRSAPEPETIDRLNANDAAEWIRLARDGDFESAWSVSDRIRSRGLPPRSHELPRHFQRIWDGTPLQNRRVLIRCYHGLGDSIQFVRYVPRVKQLARHVTVWAQRDLLPIFERTYPEVDWLELHDGSPEAHYEVDIEVMELPYAFRTTQATIPGQVPYLHVRTETLGPRDVSRAPSSGLPRVGLVWRAGDWDTRRSIPFTELERLLDLPSLRFYRVQQGSTQSETHPNLRPFPNESVLSTAEHLRALDLLISIDSMPAHLAGALGIPVWTLLTHEADWRWMQDRRDSPWYPSMRLFRQPSSGDWAAVIDEVCGSASSFQLPASS